MGRRSRHPWFDSPKLLMLWSLSWTSPNTLHLHEAPAISKFDTSEFQLDKKLAKHEIIEISMWWNFMKWKCSSMQSVENTSTFYSAQHDFFSHDLSQNFRRISQPICCFAIFCKGTTYSRTNCYCTYWLHLMTQVVFILNDSSLSQNFGLCVALQSSGHDVPNPK